jgi:hypothetical protein
MGVEIRTVTVKGDRAAERTIEQYLKDGWELVNAGSRRQAGSMHHGATLLLPPLGLLTRKQKHTLTFSREKKVKPPKAGLNGHAKGCVCNACCDARLAKRSKSAARPLPDMAQTPEERAAALKREAGWNSGR